MSSYGTNLARELRKRQTPQEKLLWKRLRNRRLLNLKFNRQFVIRYDEHSIFIVDFYCHEKKLIIELDGGYHIKTRRQDQLRDQILSSMGYQVLRIKNEELSMLPNVLRKIEEKCNTD